MHVTLPLVALICALGGTASYAVAPQQTETTTEQTQVAPLNFSRLDDFLSQIVFDVGRSEHRRVPTAAADVGTNLRSTSNKSSWTEGNRIPFSKLSDTTKDYITNLKQELEYVIQTNGLGAYSDSDQLAFLLNLHNITVIETISKNYPITDVSKLVDKKKGENVAWDEKVIDFGRVKVSIRQIEGLILKKWQSPLVLYGLHRGAIGTPNIRRDAYNGEKVWEQLEENAIEFINSIRGTQQWSKTMKVSTHYALGKRQFPDFDTDLRAHIFNYLEEPARSKYAETTSLDVSIDDWLVSDLAGGKPNASSRAGNSIGAGVSNAGVTRWGSKAQTNLPPHTIALMSEVQERAARRTARVSVEKVDGEKSR